MAAVIVSSGRKLSSVHSPAGVGSPSTAQRSRKCCWAALRSVSALRCQRAMNVGKSREDDISAIV